MTDFFKGIVAGFAVCAVIAGVVLALVVVHYRDKELLEYAEKQIEIETLREDYGARDPYEFLDDVPGARRAADDASADFQRRRDEAIQRIRGGNTD